jgi:DNA-binding response OmpR family regulator
MSNHTILLVEDDKHDVFFFQRAMETAGLTHSLHVARDGSEALEYLSGNGTFADRQRFPLPCMVLLDLNLPGQHGLEVLQWIRGHAPDPAVPVIVLSSSTSDRDLREAYRLGANSCLNKPFGTDELVALVRALDVYWFQYNRLPPPRIA